MKTFKTIVLISLLAFPIANIFAQSTGDYRTLYTTGGPYNWNTAANWQVYNVPLVNGTWQTATSVPPSSNEVISIQAGSNYTLNVNFTSKGTITNNGTITI